MSLDNALSTPLYEQLYKKLIEKINTGELKAGDKIPSERELCEEYGLSRITVRQAIKTAINEGYLYSMPGKGTFVKNQGINQELVTLVGFKQSLLARGLKPSMKLLRIEKLPGDIGINGLLGLSLEEEIMRVKVLGLADGVPMAFFNYSVSAALGNQIIDELKGSLEKGEWFSFTGYLRRMGFNVNRIKQTLEAQVADESVAQVLSIPKLSPVFLVTSLMYTKENEALEYRTAYFRGDWYKFNITRWIK